MAIIISEIKLPPTSNDIEAMNLAAAMVKLQPQQIKKTAVSRFSIDARHGVVNKVYSVYIELVDRSAETAAVARCKSAVIKPEYVEPIFNNGFQKIPARPVIVGFGPAGMFAALVLAEKGFRPVVFERGSRVEDRKKSVDCFFSGGKLDLSGNVQFGEGGAGTFSDGKLTTRIGDPLCEYVLKKFVEFGAPEEILYSAKPHIGTDKLVSIVKNIRTRITELSGDVSFLSKAEQLVITNGKLTGVIVNGERVDASDLILSIGHSARDTFYSVRDSGIELEAKNFAIGARIEHRQEFIDRAMYGSNAGKYGLVGASYQLAARNTKLPAFTFCMCPGGSVVAAASDNCQLLTNGMSSSGRDSGYANSAVVVGVAAADFGNDPFKLIDFQKEIEDRAYTVSGGVAAPACSAAKFLKGEVGLGGTDLKGSYPRGVMAYDFDRLLPKFVTDNMRAALSEFDRKINGFNRNALLTGPETRTSSPIRIKRGDNRQASKAEGLYPCGEGAGYAGGIMSAAVDGIKSAAEIISKYR